ncbi:MAG: 4Fe-4S dicluster domain-containing protein, partial [Clostridium sp.]
EFIKMNKEILSEKFNLLLKKLSKDYRIIAPKSFQNEGRYSYNDDIRYSEISTIEEIVFNKKSTGSPKEVLLPIIHTISIKVKNQIINTVSEEDERDILLFVHPCDIHGITRIDNTFKNDEYYQSRRKKIKFVMIECIDQGWDNCFCTSLGTNKTEDYSIALKVLENKLQLSFNDNTFVKYMNEFEDISNFNFTFVESNKITVKVPNLESWDKMALDKIKNSEIWNEFKERCIGCGSCNMACMTCTCMNTVELPSEESKDVTVKNRIWNGCQLIKSKDLKKETLSQIVPKRILQRVLDKFYRPKLKESKEQICVGCGRCIDVCPKNISFASTVNKFSQELDNIYKDFGRSEN